MHNLLLNSDFSVEADGSPMYYVDENHAFSYDNLTVFGARTCSLTFDLFEGASRDPLKNAYSQMLGGNPSFNEIKNEKIDRERLPFSGIKNERTDCENELSFKEIKNESNGKDSFPFSKTKTGKNNFGIGRAVVYYEPFLETNNVDAAVFGVNIRAVEVLSAELFAEFFDAAFNKIDEKSENITRGVGYNFSRISCRFKVEKGAAYFRPGIKIGGKATALTLFRPFAYIGRG